MSDSSTPVLPPAIIPSTGLVQTLLNLSLTAFALLRPLYEEADGTISDFEWVYLNAAGQRMLRQPECPSASLLTLFPMAKPDGVFAKCCQAYETGEPQRNETNYQADGLDGWFILVAQRHEDLLVVNFTDTNAQPRTGVEQALRESQAREQLALAQAERERNLLQAMLTQAPVAIALFREPDARIISANERMAELWGRATPAEVVGRPLLLAIPELAGQGFDEMIRTVYTTQVPYVGTEAPARIRKGGRLVTRYYTYSCQPIYDVQQQLLGVLNIGTEVTEQVEARQQVQQLNEELATLNEELTATNEELQAANSEYTQLNSALQETQRQLRQLNRELETRVQERTQQLAEQRVLLEQILGQAPAAICLMREPDHRIEYANPAYQALFPGQVLLGRTLAQVQPTNTALVTLFDGVYTTGHMQSQTEVPLLVPQPAGQPPQLRYFDFTYQAFREQGRIAGVTLFGTDVTERVESRRRTEDLQAELLATAQRQAQMREELYQVFEQSPVAIFVASGPTYVLEVLNDPMVALLGKPREQLLGQPYFTAVPVLKGQGFEELLDQVWRSGQAAKLTEMPAQLTSRPAGELAYFNFVYQPLFDAQGQVHSIACVAVDVTESVQASRAVETSAQRLRVLTDALPVLIGYLDRERRYQFTNEAYRAWFNIDPANLLGRRVRDIVGEVPYQNTAAFMDRALAGERVEFETSMPYRPDFHRYIHTDYIPDVQGGEVQGFSTLVTDITEQTLARQQVEKLNDELQASNGALAQTNAQLTSINADLDTFVYTASHDLKAPVTNLEGLLAALQEELTPEVTPQVRYILDLMQHSLTRFQATLGHLATFTHQTAELAAEPTEVDVAALVEDVRLDLADSFTAARAELHVETTECERVAVPPKVLRSIVFNLISNALKYRAPGRVPRILVRAHCQLSHKQLELAVEDNGLGLSEHQQANLFQLFQRLHTHVDGSGVGLYSIKRLIDQAGGTITVKSAVDVGSTFTVILPLTA